MEERVDPRLFNLRTDGFPVLVRGSVLKAQYAVVHAATPTSVRIAYDPEFDTDDLDDRWSYQVLGITTLGHPVVEEERREGRVDDIATIDNGGFPVNSSDLNSLFELAWQTKGRTAMPFVLRMSARTYRALEAALSPEDLGGHDGMTIFNGVLCAPLVLVAPGDAMPDGVIDGYADVVGPPACRLQHVSVLPADYPMYR